MEGPVTSLVLGGTIGLLVVLLTRYGAKRGWSPRRTWVGIAGVALGLGAVIGLVAAALD
ncbi:hypothetical protein [Nocardioides alkalitolerans]|uniref:hypothetical protein n=1 Tax=Nocardioides alkalitolerans TaxID=281714 RepID=UPI000417FD41|nr:hypothetical protein [Nocardioides alkalitolerans]